MNDTTKIYLSHTIRLTDSMEFNVKELDKNYPSYAQAKEAIERADKATNAVAKKKLSIACVNDEGEPITITGIHTGHGHLLTVPKIDSYRNSYLYPDVAWIKEAIERKRKTDEESNRLLGAINEFRLSWDGGGWRWDVSKYPSEIERLERVMAELKKSAEKTNLASAMKKQE